MSDHDTALGMSQMISNRARLGQMFGSDDGSLSNSTRIALHEYRDVLSVINVSTAEGSDSGNGHGYFRSSPWASSDILMTLHYNLSPEQRGLVEQDGLPIYTFPADYIEQLWEAIGDVDPEFSSIEADLELK
jgi:hypothetical protein